MFREGLGSRIPANTRRRTNAVLMLAHCLRRWSNIKPALVQYPVFAGIVAQTVTLSWWPSWQWGSHCDNLMCAIENKIFKNKKSRTCVSGGHLHTILLLFIFLLFLASGVLVKYFHFPWVESPIHLSVCGHFKSSRPEKVEVLSWNAVFSPGQYSNQRLKRKCKQV